jgi:hypothetical protein
VLAVVLALVGIGVAAAVLLLKPGVTNSPVIDRMVPSSTAIYATAFLNPPVGQKMNLLRLAHKFPDWRTDQDLNLKIDDALNQGFKNWGLSAQDIRPWLGGQLGLAVQLEDGSPALLLVDVKDEGKARAALNKLRNSEQGRQRTWKEVTYSGITVSVGKPASGSATDNLLYALVDHTVLLGNSEVLMQDAIDADQGKKARLADSPDYRSIAGKLPREKLLLAYVSGKPVADRLKKESGRGLHFPVPELTTLDAFQGLGFTVTARSNGLATDLEMKVDAPRLDSQTRNTLSLPSHKNTAVAWLPRRAYGFLATTVLKDSIQSYLDAVPVASQERRELEEYGFLGRFGVLAHLTGDAALEIGPGAGQYPAGALVVATDDPNGLHRFLDRITAAYLPSSSRSQSLLGQTSFSKQTYKGVEITSVTTPELNPWGFNLAYAVSGEVGIIASSPQELQAVIDAGQTAKSIATAELYLAATKEVHSTPTSVIYVDIAETAAAVRALTPYDANAAANIAPLKAFILTVENGTEHISQRSFLLIS